MRSVAPVSPGEMLDEEFLKPLGLTKYRLAKDIGVPPQRMYEARVHPCRVAQQQAMPMYLPSLSDRDRYSRTRHGCILRRHAMRMSVICHCPPEPLGSIRSSGSNPLGDSTTNSRLTSPFESGRYDLLTELGSWYAVSPKRR